MDKVSRLKSYGYVFSIVSVILLGVVAVDGVSDKPMLLVCLLMGMATSVVGMALRWRSQLVKNGRDRIGTI